MEALTLYNDGINIVSNVSLKKDDKQLPASKVKIYGLDNKDEIVVFNTIEARSRFDDFIGRPITYGYIGAFAGKREAIKVTYEDSMETQVITRNDNDSYYSLDLYEWNKNDKNVWTKEEGDLSTLYHMIGNKAHLEKTLTRIK